MEDPVPLGSRDVTLGTSGWVGTSAKVSERLAHFLASQILDSDIAPGTQLPSEREMMETYGVARNTLREALRLLESRGLLRMKLGPQGGPVVRRPTSEGLSYQLSLLLHCEGSTYGDILEARLMLEPQIAALAATNISKPELERLEGTVSAMTSARDDGARAEANWLFHSGLARATGNPALVAFVESLKSLSDGGSIGIPHDSRRTAAAAHAHERVLQALRDSDPTAAREAMEGHLAEFAANLRRLDPGRLLSRVEWSGRSQVATQSGRSV